MAGIRIQLELDDGTFTTRMLHAGESLDKFNAKVDGTARSFQRVEPAHRNFIGHMRDVIVIVAAARLAFENLRTVLTGWGGEIIKVNAEFERMTYLLAGMSKAADPMKDAVAQVKELRKEALQTPYSLKAIADTFVKIRATGIDPMNGSMKATIDTVAAFGGTESQLKRASLAIQEMAGKGVVQTKELRRQLGQDIPRAVELMARALGVSQEQLSAIMERGTLDAKSSMDKMFGEWERTFGGAGARLMQTFNGQLQQTITLIQNLALDTGNAGFFDASKEQLKQFNEFLSGTQAKVLATSFGSAMAAVVHGLRSGLDFAIKFRSEISGVIVMLAGGFALKVAVSSFLSLGTAIGRASTAMVAYRGELTALAVAWRTNNLDFMLGGLVGRSPLTGQFTKALPAISGWTLAWRNLGVAVRFAGVALSFTAQYLIPIAAVLLATAYAFGLFEDKVNDAYEAVKKYGAQDKEQLRLAEQKLAQEEKALDLLYKQRDLRDQRNLVGSVAEGIVTLDTKTPAEQADEILKQEDKTTEVYKTLIVARAAFKKQEEAKAIRDENALIAEERAIHQRGYDEERREQDKKFAEDRASLQKHHQATREMELANQQRAHNWAVSEAQWQYDLLQKHIEEMKRLGDKNPSSAAVIVDLLKQQREAAAQLYRAQNSVVGPQQFDKHMNLQDALDKADSIIKKLQGDTEKYRAELAGVSGEVAQFFYAMSDEGRSKKMNIFGDSELENKIKLAKELFAQMEALKEQARGREKYDHDINAAADKAAERRFAAEHRDADDFDKIQIKKEQGAYKGLTNTQRIQSAMQGVMENIAHATGAAKTSMSELLGAEMQGKGKGLLAVLRNIAGEVGSFQLKIDRPKIGIGGTEAQAVINDSARAPVGNAGNTPEEQAKIDQGREDNRVAKIAESTNKLHDKEEELRGVIQVNNATASGLNTRVRELTAAIKKGVYGDAFRDPKDPRYASAFGLARAGDASEQAKRNRDKAASRVEHIAETIANDKLSLTKREADLQRRFAEDAVYKTPTKLSHIEDKFDREIATLQKSGGSPAKIAELQELKRRNIDIEAASVLQAEQKKSDAIEKGLMTADAARKFDHDNEIKRLDEELARVSKNSQFRIEAEREVARAKDLLARKELADSPLGREMKNYIDWGNNMQQASAGWMNTFTDDLAKMVMKGKVNFKSLADSIVQDMVRIGIRGAIGSLFGPMFGLGGAIGGGAGKIGGGAGKINSGNLGGTAGGLAAVHHAGGIAGSVRATRMVDLATFVGAQRFHQGGFPGMGRNEVPIIVERGEEVGWPDKLAKKYGGRGGSVMHNNVTVNATGGRPQDNQDLAERVGRAVEESARVMIAQEIRTQMKPGGMAYKQ